MQRGMKTVVWALAAAAAGLALIQWVPHGAEGWVERSAPATKFQRADQALKDRFAERDLGLDAGPYEAAFMYLLEGHIAYRSAQGAFVHYPGAHGAFGRKTEGVEGFARFFPLGAAWLASGRPDRVRTQEQQVSISALLREGLLSGTRADGPEYWGPVESRKQRLVEAADVALGLWLSREQIWNRLAPAERRQVVAWLSQAVSAEPWPNNWLLFPVTVHQVLKALGEGDCCDARASAAHYERFKTFYRGGGMFVDPPNGFDYYNAWSVHYSLFWFDQIDAGFDPAFIRQASGEFASFYKQLMSPQGPPMMGRSICYRLATPVPLLTAQVLAPDQVSPGVAMRAMDAVWGHFVEHGALSAGTITQGYCGEDLSVVDHYTGPGSCLWSARSLVLAFYLDRKTHLLSAEREPLPVERGDFVVENRLAHWTARGTRATGEVTLELGDNASDYQGAVREYGLRHQLLEFVRHNPQRPDNHEPLYKRRIYSSHAPAMACKGS